MKKIFMMLVMFVCVMTASAQMVSWHDHMYLGINGYKYSRADIPGGAWMDTGDNVMTKANEYFMRLRHDDPEAYVREYNAFMMRGGLAGIQPVGVLTTNYGVGMTGGMVGGGMMMAGGAMGMVGGNAMVYGSSGVAGATSNVQITNQSLLPTVGSPTQGSFNVDTNGNVSFNFGGDLLGGIARTIDYIKGSGKKTANGGFTNGQLVRDTDGNQYVVNNGQLIPVQTQQTMQQVQYQQQTTRSAQPVQQVQTRQGQQPVQRTNTQATGFASGY